MPEKVPHEGEKVKIFFVFLGEIIPSDRNLSAHVPHHLDFLEQENFPPVADP